MIKNNFLITGLVKTQRSIVTISKGAPKQDIKKPKFYPKIYEVRDDEWTIIPPNLPTAITTTYIPDKDPYPFFTVPNGVGSAALGKQPTDRKPAPKLRVPRPQRNY